MVASVDQNHLATEPAYGLGHLHADRPAAEDEQSAGHRLHRGGLAVGPHAVELAQPGNRRDDRVGAVREHDMVGGVAYAVDLHGPDAGEPTAAAEQGDVVVGQPLLLAGIGVVGDHEVPPRQRPLDVDLGRRERLAGAVDRFPGTQQCLGRDARVVGALAADEFTLHDGHPESTGGERTGAVLAR